MTYQSIIVREKMEWDAYVKRSRDYEVYHTWYYHTLNRLGEPLLFVYEESGFFIAFPMLKRSIANSSFYDLTSVYGYAGPVSDCDFSSITVLSLQHFKEAFCRFLTDERCICVFTRLYPFLSQECVLDYIGGVSPNGSTIYMDLSMTIEEQHSRYHKRLKRQVKKLREAGYTIKDSCSPEEITLFTEMYHRNMDRLNASKSYYFDEAYFTGLLNQKEFNNRLILIYDGTELICGAVILISGKVIRNHLSATSEKYLNESPSKLLTDEISMIGRRLGKKFFHLGGGVGGKEDSLFEFKRHFSDLQIADRIWCYINDRQAYDELVLQRVPEIYSESAFFPAYRQ